MYGHCSSFPPEEGLAGARRGLRIILRTPEERRQRPVGRGTGEGSGSIKKIVQPLTKSGRGWALCHWDCKSQTTTQLPMNRVFITLNNGI